MPLASSPIPSSFSEQSIPSETTPRILVALIARPPGSVARGGAKAVRSPGAALGAPQITENFRSGRATRQRRLWWPAGVGPRSFSMASISPTTTPDSPSTTGLADAPSIPARTSRSLISAGPTSVSTNSLSHRYEIFPGASSASLSPRGRGTGEGAELAEEAQVVLEEEPDIVDAVLEHGDALDAHAEGPARHLLGVIAHIAEHVGMHHARAQDLDPPILLADAAALAPAEEAEHGHLGGGLREREERGAEADARAAAEHLPREEIEGAAQIAHGDVAVHGQALDMVEHGRMRDVGVAPVRLAGADDADRRRLRLHGPDLDRGRVGAERRVGCEVEGVLHVPRRGIVGEVERGEVVVVRLHLGALGDGEAEPLEDGDDLVLHAGDRVDGPRGREAPGKGEVHPPRLPLPAELLDA